MTPDVLQGQLLVVEQAVEAGAGRNAGRSGLARPDAHLVVDFERHEHGVRIDTPAAEHQLHLVQVDLTGGLGGKAGQAHRQGKAGHGDAAESRSVD